MTKVDHFVLEVCVPDPVSLRAIKVIQGQQVLSRHGYPPQIVERMIAFSTGAAGLRWTENVDVPSV